MAKIMISVVIFRAAFENQKASLFIHFPAIVVFQNAATGTHMTIEPKKKAHP